MNHRPPDFAALVRRCADGELAPADRPALLAALRADPAGYEPLALALLERQTLAAALRSSVASIPAPTPLPAARPWRRAAGLLATAAAGLAVGLGVNVSRSDSRQETGAAALVMDPAPTPIARPAPQPVAKLSWATGPGTAFTLPVYDGEEVPPGFGADPLTPAERAELVRTGRYAGEWRQEYTVALDDGRLLTIPVHAVGVRGPEVF